MVLNNIHLYFLESPSRMDKGAKTLALRLKCSEDDIRFAKDDVRRMLSAVDLLKELDDNGFKGSVKDASKTLQEASFTATNDFNNDIIKRQCQSEIKEQKDKYNTLLSEYEGINKSYNDLLRLQDYPSIKYIMPFPEYKRQGASIITASDWHVEKVIEKKSMNGVNEYNPDIAKKRSEKFADNAVKLIKRDREEFDKHDTVLFLNGDFIEGYIHPESQTILNSMTPVEAVAFADELLTNAITHILNNSGTDKMTILCQNGNHSRTTKRMESSIDHRMSYETMLYSLLANKFKGDIEFSLPYSDVSYVNILGKNIRYFHGHQCKFGGGIGGLTVPLIKFIHRQNSINKADYNIMSHYHNLSLPTSDCMLNGSLCGFDNYAQTLGCSYEPAMQGYRLLDSKYGFTSFNPIICE